MSILPTMVEKDSSFSLFMFGTLLSFDSREVITISPRPILLHYGLLEMVLKTI